MKIVVIALIYLLSCSGAVFAEFGEKDLNRFRTLLPPEGLQTVFVEDPDSELEKLPASTRAISMYCICADFDSWLKFLAGRENLFLEMRRISGSSILERRNIFRINILIGTSYNSDRYN